jgi:hypothetical protein
MPSVPNDAMRAPASSRDETTADGDVEDPLRKSAEGRAHND